MDIAVEFTFGTMILQKKHYDLYSVNHVENLFRQQTDSFDIKKYHMTFKLETQSGVKLFLSIAF